MRKNLNRALAILLSVALLVSCSISGLVLPALASANVDLLQGKLGANSYTVQPGTSAFPEAQEVALENGGRYVMRFESKGSNGFVSFTDGNNAWRRQNVKDTGDNWRSYQVMFIANGASGKFAGQIKNEGATNTLQVRNIQLFKAPQDGSFDVMTGGDMDTQTEFFGRQFDGANGGPQIVADPDDASNSVMYFPKSNETTYATRYTDLPEVVTFDNTKVYKFTFRMKGYLRITSYVTNPTYLPNPDAYSITGNGQHTYFHSPDSWSTFSYYIKIGSDAGYLEFWNSSAPYGSSQPLWLDDLQIYELPAPTALTMSKSEVGIYPGNGTQLSVTATPEFAYLKDGDIAWTSSDPNAVSVDSKGNVKVETTAAFGTQATITARYSDTVFATCVVTVDENAPKPPAYSVVGVNGFEGVDTSRTVNNGDDPAEILANVLLKANTRYAVRYTAKSSALGASISHNGGADTDLVPASTEWQTSQFMFTTDAAAAGTVFKLTVSPAATAGATLQIKDVEIWGAPTDGTFNVMPAGDFDAQSQLFADYYADGVINTVDPDNADNNVLCYPADGSAHNKYWGIKDIVPTAQYLGTKFRVTFRFKGQLRLENWSSGDFMTWNGVPTKIGYNNSNGIRYLWFESENWTTLSFDFDVKTFGDAQYVVFANANQNSAGAKPLYIDDFSITEIVTATGLQMSLSELPLYPTNHKLLTVTGFPEGSYLDPARVTWKSSDESVATVDQYGNVTARDVEPGKTAIITAMLDGVDAATCLVTIDLTAPKPPVDTQPGVNAMADVPTWDLAGSENNAVRPGAKLKANTRYVLRYTTKNTSDQSYLSTNARADAYFIPVTNDWYANQVMFTTVNAVDDFEVCVYSGTGDGTVVQVKDWALYEAPKDGTFDVMPGGDFESLSAFLKGFASTTATFVPDPDNATGRVMFMPKSPEGSSFYSYMNSAGIWSADGIGSGLVKITFAYKGGVRFEIWHQDAAFVKDLCNGTLSADGKTLSFLSKDAWATATIYMTVKSYSGLNYTAIRNAVDGVAYNTYIDNMQVFEIPDATSAMLERETLNLYPTDHAQLKVLPVPEVSYLDMAQVTWKSDNNAAVTVTTDGVVTAVGANGESATITVLYKGVAVDTCVVTVDETATKPPVETTPGNNALADVADFDLAAAGSQVLDPRVTLKAGTRYALRFVTKSNVAGATVEVNVPGVNVFKVPQTTEWRANQMLFTARESVYAFTVTVTTPAGDTVTLNTKDWELYEAPVDGSFNLIPGSDSSAQTAFLTNHFNGKETNAVELVPDPDNANNTVIKFPATGSREYLALSAIGGYQDGKVWKLTFRMKGNFRFENWGADAVYAYQPDAYDVTGDGQYACFASTEWQTFSYYIKPAGNNQAVYIQLANKSAKGGNIESYIDDIQLYEIDGSSVLSIQEQDLHLYPTSTKQLTAVYDTSVLLGGTLTWTSSDTNVVLVDAKTGRITLVGDPGQKATITASNAFFKDGKEATTVITVDESVEHAPPVTSVKIKAPLGREMDKGQQSQLLLIGDPVDNLVGRTTWTTSDARIVSVDARGNIEALGAGTATITGTTEFGLSAEITITVHGLANLLVNGDFEQGPAVSWRESKAVQDGVGQNGSVGFVFNGATSQYYSQDVLVKPATTYIISYWYKAEKGADFRLYTGSLGASNLKPSVFVEPGTIDTAEWQYAKKTFTTADYIDPENGYVFSLTTSETDNVGTGVYAYVDNVAIREYIVGSPVEELAIEQKDVTLAPGRATKLTLKATPSPADLNAVEWTSSNEQVAYVVAGNVTAIGGGETVITAKAKSGATATCKVTVNGMTAPLQNGTFETVDDPKTAEVEGAWSLSGNAEYSVGNGVVRSTAIRFDPKDNTADGGSISQTFKGLKADTAYQVLFRYRLRNSDTIFSIKITNSKGEEIAKGELNGEKDRAVSYSKDLTKVDFITPATLTEDEELTITFTYETGEEYVMLDHVAVIESASEVDLIVSDITWSPDNADQLTPDTKVSFIVSVVNQGKEAYAGGKPFAIDIMVDSRKVKTLTYQGKIDVGEMLMVTTPAGDEWVATAGDHMITARVNSTMTILESDDTNNYTTVNLRVAKEEEFVKAPEAALAMGYNRLTFSDHFTTQDTIDKTASGNHGYKWYVTRPWGESNLTADDYRIEDGILYLTTHQTAWNYSMCTVDAKHSGVGYGFNMGYMEIRLRMKETGEGGKVNGIRVPAVWAFSCDTIWGTRPKGQTSLELDWIEYWGNKYGKLRFDTTLHETRYDENGNQTSKVSSGEKHYEPIGDYQWHTYGMAWSKGLLKTYFDNELIATLKYSEDDYPDPMPSGKINVGGDDDPYEGLWSVLDTQTMPIILGGASDFPLEVDWIHVWQSDGSLDPIEEKDEAVTDFVDQYLTDDNGKVVNKVTIDNYEDILKGEKVYLNLTEEQRAEIDKLIGGSYVDLVAEIYAAQAKAENFIPYYACAEDGTPYTVVDATNYEWIAGAKAEWDAMTEFERALIDKLVLAQSNMTFTQMLEAALNFVAEDKPVDDVPVAPTPVKSNLLWLWITLGVLGGIIVIGGVTIVLLLFVKKKKKTNA
ncbi:MAG: Ig-like domain-containing protein [Clostridia bacterium]|nr:Ig-like domain-containing protein [Clostridia bacterium]